MYKIHLAYIYDNLYYYSDDWTDMTILRGLIEQELNHCYGMNIREYAKTTEIEDIMLRALDELINKKLQKLDMIEVEEVDE